MHEQISHLGSLVGTWRGRGNGIYPTIPSFAYLEEVTFGHVGKPFLAYTQKTRDAETDLPLHAEAGYLRPDGVDRAEFVVAQPSGIVEVLHGSVSTADGLLTLQLTTSSVTVTNTAKEVTAVRRTLTVNGDEMAYQVDMAAVGQPMQRHLEATLLRVKT